jgi:uncharacterized protein (DUF1330 family)
LALACNQAGNQPLREPVEPVDEDLSKLPADVSLSATEFFAAYSSNRDEAFQKHGGKIIDLTGVVEQYGRNINDDVFLQLRVANRLSGICLSADKEPWAYVVPGQTVRLRGRWKEKLSTQGIRLLVVETDAKRRVAVSAMQLAGEFSADADASTRKYEGKHLILRGVVEAVDFKALGGGSVVLKGDGKLQVECNYSTDERTTIRAIQIGEEIGVVGDGADLNAGRVLIRYCFTITKDPPNIPINPNLGFALKE